MFSKIDSHFNNRTRGIAAIGALAFALVWAILWDIFPMQFYSFFFADTIGSNIQLILINTVVLLPFFWLFTKLSRTDLSFSGTVLLNILLVVGVEYVFSIFLFSDYFFICVIAVIIHAAINILPFGSAAVRDGKAPKGMNAPAPKAEKAIKKQPLISVIWAASFAFAVDAVSFGLFFIVAHIYVQ